MKHFAIFFIILFLSQITGAQDIRFSDFYKAPLILNPGNTGNFAGNLRLMNNYRRQAINTDDPYVTGILTYEQPIYFLKERIGAGLVYINDVSGYGMLKVNKVYASLAYYKAVSEKSYLHAGFQFGYVHKRFSAEGITFPDQFDNSTGYYNANIISCEAYRNQSLGYFDMNWGMLWTRRGKTLQTETGIAMFHYNRPEETFYENGNKLPIRWAFHFYPDIKLHSSYYLAPKILYVFQGKASELLLGTDLAYRPDNAGFKRAHIGGYFRGGFNRMPDILIFGAGIDIGNWQIGIAYDKETNGFTSGTFTRNAFEFSLCYIAPLTHLKERIIPCELF